MVNEAKQHEAEDKEKRRKVDVRNNADAAVFQAEKQLKELGDKINADDKSKIEAGIARVKEALKNDNLAEIESSSEALNQLWHEAASKMYQQSSAQQGNAGNTNAGGNGQANQGGDKKDSDAVDADFEVVND